MSHHDHFSPDYQTARDTFRAACGEAGIAVKSWPHDLRGMQGEALATDTAWIGPKDASRVLVTCSGTHGVEGHYGSGCQVGFLREGHYRDLPADTAVLLVHATNPYGFSWTRRVNEDNIDINRNFIDFGRPVFENGLYLQVADLLAPEAWNAEVEARTRAGLAAFVAKAGVAGFGKAVVAGQRTHPNGLFFGGTSPCWSNRTIGKIVPHYLEDASHVCVLDFHTGLGPFGYSEMICRHPPGSPPLALARRWFGDAVTSPAAGESESPVIEGNLRMAFVRLLPEAVVVASAIEVGTLPADEVNMALIADNWLHIHGDPQSEQGRAIKQRVRDAFYCDRDDWRDACYPRAIEIQKQALAGLAAT
ncbi:M14 family metallopeptidase [Vineibacter terrae]|uniref:M14 family metallopeptidase n=1 Tax=Vineibacter terrae TaxID=2586908 RepID=UPI002E31ED0F|nr:M14 family metallopeptidase [Vineibacter terrae]HEX2890692.1 M14 family metallopeptidase [Vineibacter terrae]